MIRWAKLRIGEILLGGFIISLLRNIVILDLVFFLVALIANLRDAKLLIIRFTLYVGVILQIAYITLAINLDFPIIFTRNQMSLVIIADVLAFNLFFLATSKIGKMVTQWSMPFYNIVFLLLALSSFPVEQISIPALKDPLFTIYTFFSALAFAVVLFQLNLWITYQNEPGGALLKTASRYSVIVWILCLVFYSLWSYSAWGRFWSWDFQERQYFITLLLLILNHWNYSLTSRKASFFKFLLLVITLFLLAIPMHSWIIQGHGGYA